MFDYTILHCDFDLADSKPIVLEVSNCFKPSQPQRIISGLRETLRKRYIIERTNKAEIQDLKNRVRKQIVVRRENLWNEIQMKGPQRQK